MQTDIKHPETKQALETLEVKYANLKNLYTNEIIKALNEYNDALEDVRKKAAIEVDIGESVTSDNGNFTARGQKKATRGQVDYPTVDLLLRAIHIGGINASKGLNIGWLAENCGEEGKAIVGELNALNKAHVGNTSDNGTTEKTIVLTDKTTLKTQMKIAQEWAELMRRCDEAYAKVKGFSVSIEGEGAAEPQPVSHSSTTNAQSSGM